jgi:hypothetical protein
MRDVRVKPSLTKGVFMGGVSVGSIVESKCGKCNDVTGHNVMAMVAGNIIKVECRACGSVHKYRPADKAAPAGRTESVRRTQEGGILPAQPKKSPPSFEGQARDAKKNAPPAYWQDIVRLRETQEPAPYSVNGTFPLKSLIAHPVFGLGQVLVFIAPDKVDVVFEAGIKRLKCAGIQANTLP